jgi:hypothetical protein
MQQFESIMQQNDLFVKKMGCYNQCKFRDAVKSKRTKIRAALPVYIIHVRGLHAKNVCFRFIAFPRMCAGKSGPAHRSA